jgi:hypothetical protein
MSYTEKTRNLYLSQLAVIRDKSVRISSARDDYHH